MSRMSSHVRNLLGVAAFCWAAYLLMFVFLGSSFGNSHADRAQLGLMQILLYAGLGALIVGLAGWARDQEAHGRAAVPAGAHRSQPRGDRTEVAHGNGRPT